MTKILYTTILLLLSYYYSYSQEQTPAIEWTEPYSGGTRGGSITAFPGPNVLFALVKAQNSNSGTASISKFYADGLVKNQYIVAAGGSGNAPIMSQYASQDGGALVYLFYDGVLRRYDASLNVTWQKTVSFTVQNATATLANGYYILANTFANNKTFLELKRMKNDGSIEWSVDITDFASVLTDIQTSSDDGVIITSANGLRKYSVTGKLVWSNTTILDASQLIITDPSIMYVYTNSSNSNIRNIIQLNTSTGVANWTKSLVGESIIDFERTSDNGCVFSTNTGMYKYNSTGALQWKNIGYSSAKITTTGDGKIFVIKNNSITKLTFDNEVVWTKSFNNDYYIVQDVHGASDFGLYVTAVKNGAIYNTNPDFLLFKLSSPDTPCKTKFDVIGESATFCRTGSFSLSSKIGNGLMEYLIYLTNFSFQWYKNNVPIESATNFSYIASQSGNYSLKIKQKSCETISRNVELNIVNQTPPVIEADTNQICAGNSISLRAKGCDGVVVWSNGARSLQITVTPQATTAYNALCERTVNNELCQSFTSANLTITVLSSSNLKISDIAGKREFCENGFTELKPTVSGGIAPITYTWKKGNSSLAGPNITINEDSKYVLLVVDKIGCYDISDTIRIKKIANPIAPTINTPASTVICANKSIVLTTDIKENSYQWLLNNIKIEGAVSQFYAATSPGSYQLKVFNASDCSNISDNSIVISSSDLKINSIEGNRAFCESASTELRPAISGGATPFTYEWTKDAKSFSEDSSISINEGGDYRLSIKDNTGCTVHSDTVKIKKLANPTSPVINSPASTEICSNGSAVLTTDARESSYQWLMNSTAIDGAVNQFYTAKTPGKYQVKVTNINNCSSISDTAITITQLIIPQPSIQQADDTLISSASAGNKWYLNGNELPFVTQKIKFIEVGNYQVKVTERSCESLPSVAFLPVVLANEQAFDYIQVYPNPASDKVFVKSSKIVAYQLLDVSGRLLGQSTDRSFSHTIDLRRFSAGNYFIIFLEENGNHFVRKLSVSQ
ncbi:T9SS type A sorting domain-containing protein [Emticicia agri]|uniref:T9SS type A sorting domain-containing protein n=1 Tax=Emticicia agri TaxID=2492393 RepID=A0A4Q5LXY6_9BACT|nr:T9SS type A sorting domain-containing protein [Emticicia agri]RYU94519.1 T9SS type A sorting domain-containing protein [Emticicia agri]